MELFRHHLFSRKRLILLLSAMHLRDCSTSGNKEFRHPELTTVLLHGRWAILRNTPTNPEPFLDWVYSVINCFFMLLEVSNKSGAVSTRKRLATGVDVQLSIHRTYTHLTALLPPISTTYLKHHTQLCYGYVLFITPTVKVRRLLDWDSAQATTSIFITHKLIPFKQESK